MCERNPLKVNNSRRPTTHKSLPSGVPLLQRARVCKKIPTRSSLFPFSMRPTPRQSFPYCAETEYAIGLCYVRGAVLGPKPVGGVVHVVQQNDGTVSSSTCVLRLEEYPSTFRSIFVMTALWLVVREKSIFSPSPPAKPCFVHPFRNTRLSPDDF